MKIAVIGAGSSGLVTLKYLLDSFPASDTKAEILCFEKSQSVRGCWGNQREDFVSTSTKYTTQFSCFRKWDASVTPDKDFDEFYKGAEFGDYLEDFAKTFDLKKYIQFGVTFKSFEAIDDKWRLCLEKDGAIHYEVYDALFICTGLVNQKVVVESSKVPIAPNPEAVRNETVVVVGGGESATDIANHLAKPEYNNKVYLSLRSGVRVSPRYHPIRGVPSDFLRNRLLLSFNKGLRNTLGEGFVSFRIRFNQLLANLFPHQETENQAAEEQRLRKEWDMKLKARAKGKLFNVFHNKSDAFLDAVAQKRLKIIGPATDTNWDTFYDFEQGETSVTFGLEPDVLVPSTGYRSLLSELSNGAVKLKDFYQGCVHTNHNNLFLIGFARPIIGNIPTISEMQTRYAISILKGNCSLPMNIEKEQEQVWKNLVEEYPTLDTNNVYPVEQIPYCDSLAKAMGIMPSLTSLSSVRTWLKLMFVPASTTHYVDEYFDESMHQQEKIHTPAALISILLALRLFEFPFQYFSKSKITS